LSRRQESKQKCPLKTLDLHDYVIEKLKEGWSPQLIAGRARLEKVGKISHECIYQFIYGKDGKHLKLWEYLPRRHRKRRKKRIRKYKRTLIPNRIDISERPKSVEDRKEFGHWEDDSVVGVGRGAALNTKRERKSRYMLITKIPRKTAKNTHLATCKRFRNLHPAAKKTNTADNGSEFTQHEKTTQQTGMKFFFATPYHSWERGTNENGNGLIRRFFPKKTNFDKISNQQIKDVENWINHRPMKCLNYKTPHEVFHEHLLLAEQNFPKNCT
jgi:IS30 family transposase